MDSGALGCLGVGVPFGVAAALAFPGRQVISVNGDGAFGINAMEIDTAVRHGAKAVGECRSFCVPCMNIAIAAPRRTSRKPCVEREFGARQDLWCAAAVIN